jgi:hypothetical protein
MTRQLLIVLLAGGVTLGAVSAEGQVPPPAPAPPKPEVVAPIDERSAQEIRQQLNEILRDYPPTLAQVLRLDPSLLTRDDYLAPYPRLGTFITQHPDIARHPAFYLGSPGNEFGRQEEPRAMAIRGVVDMTSYVTLLGGFIGFFLLVGWIARLIAEHRRWLRATRTQTDVHSKLFDRLTSNEDLLAYIQTPAGQHFLQSAPIAVDTGSRAIGAPVGRILWSVQAGIVLAVVGVGLWFVKNSLIDELIGPLNVFAVLILALGAGFALSAVVAYMLSLRLGLLEPPKP